MKNTDWMAGRAENAVMVTSEPWSPDRLEAGGYDDPDSHCPNHLYEKDRLGFLEDHEDHQEWGRRNRSWLFPIPPFISVAEDALTVQGWWPVAWRPYDGSPVIDDRVADACFAAGLSVANVAKTFGGWQFVAPRFSGAAGDVSFATKPKCLRSAFSFATKPKLSASFATPFRYAVSRRARFVTGPLS